MKKWMLKWSIDIAATPEKIWDVLLTDKTYRVWTSVFHPGSYAETDWKEGSKALFKTPEGGGMISKVVRHNPGKIIVLEHYGVLKNGEEVFEGETVEKWAGTTETYRLESKNGISTLFIEQEIEESYIDWFKTTWEKALQKVKELSESEN